MASVRKHRWIYRGVEKWAWVCEYTDARTGKRHRETCASKKGADAFRMKAEREVEAGDHVPGSASTTVAKVAEAFIQHTDQRYAAGGIGESHARKTRMVVRNHIVPGLGGLLFSRLTFGDVEDWHASLKAKGLSPFSARRVLQAFKEVEDYARKRGFTAKSVVRDVCGEVRGVRSAKIRTFTPEEVRRLLDASLVRPAGRTEVATAVLACFVHIAAFSGLRFGEIAGLTVANVDFEGRTLRVRHSLTFTDKLKGPKTRAGLRDVPMPRAVADMLRSYVVTHHKPNDRALIFRSRTGEAFSASLFHTNYWRPLLTRTGLDDGTKQRHHFHALRHFAASMMIDHGLTMPTVAGLMGHNAFDMTLQVYAHEIVRGGQQHDAIDRISASLAAADATRMRQGKVAREDEAKTTCCDELEVYEYPLHICTRPELLFVGKAKSTSP